jgi:hypothetical protein
MPTILICGSHDSDTDRCARLIQARNLPMVQAITTLGNAKLSADIMEPVLRENEQTLVIELRDERAALDPRIAALAADEPCWLVLDVAAGAESVDRAAMLAAEALANRSETAPI